MADTVQLLIRDPGAMAAEGLLLENRKEKELVKKVFSVVEEVKSNLYGLVQEWREFQRELLQDNGPLLALGALQTNGPLLATGGLQTNGPLLGPGGLQANGPLLGPGGLQANGPLLGPGGKKDQQLLLVHRADLERLETEAMMLKEFLPKVLSAEYLQSFGKLTQLEQELQITIQEKEALSGEHEHLRQRTEALMTDYEQEKQEKFSVKCELSEVSQQLSQQAEYCSSMGAACCTLLWRVSRHEDCIHSILSGLKVSEFLQLVASTLQSYLSTYADGMPEESSEEAQFVLALCGIITNVAASAYGRDFLASNEDGLALVDVMCSVLSEAPTGPECAKLKSLILMSLYNISINQKGLKYLTSKPDIMKVLVWLLQEERDTTNRLHSIRLLQSMILEPESPMVIHQALEAIPMQFLEHLSSDSNPEIQETAIELMSDLQALQREP